MLGIQTGVLGIRAGAELVRNREVLGNELLGLGIRRSRRVPVRQTALVCERPGSRSVRRRIMWGGHGEARGRPR